MDPNDPILIQQHQHQDNLRRQQQLEQQRRLEHQQLLEDEEREQMQQEQRARALATPTDESEAPRKKKRWPQLPVAGSVMRPARKLAEPAGSSASNFAPGRLSRLMGWLERYTR